MSRFDGHVSDTVIHAQQNYGPAPSIVPAMLEMFLMCCMRSQSFFDEARRFVRGNQFDPVTEPHYRVVWEVLCTLRDAGSNFTSTNLVTEIHRVLADDPMYLHPRFHPILLAPDESGMIVASFNAPVTEVDVHTARGFLREFLHARTVVNPLRRFMESVNHGEVPAGMDEFLDDIIRQRDQIQSVNTLPLVDSAPALDTHLEIPSIYHTTGLEWIDEPLGGFREGDTVGLLGGTGSGKSTFAAHLAVAAAKREYYAAQAEGRSPRWVAFFTYEESAGKMRPRLWSAGFQIQRKRLENLTHPLTQLSHRGNMQPYEQNLHGSQGELLSEQERWTAGSVWMNKTLKLYDMSGSSDYPNAGNGFLPELVTCLEATMPMMTAPPFLVLADYAGLMCRNYMAANNMDDSRLRHLLANFGNIARREIAQRYGCTFVAVHQMAPSEGKRGSNALLHHTMAAEARAFAENMAACACIGNPDQTTGCRLLNWSKIRYQALETINPVTLKIDDQFATMEDVSAIYARADSGDGFVHRDVARQIHGGSQQEQRTASSNPPSIRGQSNPNDLNTPQPAGAATNNGGVHADCDTVLPDDNTGF